MNQLTLGIDIGSTTAKIVVVENGGILFEKYQRHFSQVRQKTLDLLAEAAPFVGGRSFTAAISGSAGLGLAESAGVPFVQEVFATGEVVRRLEPDASAVVELGGEDAKIIFFDGGIDERMNGSCAGGTGAFIDQMATLLNITADELDELSLESTRLYPIASRCGVFAKTDIQPLLNQGAKHADVAASIYQAVVNQTIAGLAQGKRITGKVLFLGGPLYYCLGLRKRFQETLKLDDEHAVFPEYARFAVAMGAALYAQDSGGTYTIDQLRDQIANSASVRDAANLLPPLFASEADYEKFRARHAAATVAEGDLSSYHGGAWLGIDCGSTTTKVALLGAGKELLYTYYSSNRGNPVEIVREQLEKIYELCGDRVSIRGSAVTGYGEELIQAAFGVDKGVVETIAHYTAAKYFCPQVDFILDIGGQDIKCFKIKNGAIDSIMLNEACSSGCGSFIETFARSMGYDVAAFAEKGLHSGAPVNLGSRCTVFMNSSVKQSQKDGATVEDISAGLSVSVVKNAIYKVIRAGSADELGDHVVVQGGTFYNDAVLRAFEMELGKEVIRPAIAGLMGAYGAALYAMEAASGCGSTLISPEDLRSFQHTAKAAACQGCTNHCRLTINSFGGRKKYISGNQCQKGLGLANAVEMPNIHAWKRDALLRPKPGPDIRGTIGLPLALGMYELLPLWQAFFTRLGFRVEVSGLSSRRIYEKGQFSIPSDTACYPAKIMHGHIELLLEKGVDAIFYPGLTYNMDEKESDNHYNCPVVAYYSELLHGNMDDLAQTHFLYPFLNINNRKELTKELHACLEPVFPGITKKEVKEAVTYGFLAYASYMRSVRVHGERAVAWARKHGKRIMILAGRPYHIDPEIGHGIDKLAASLGFVVVSEDSVCHLADPVPVHVLNQWTYHARLYRAARFACENPDVQLVQLVSFGCGLDAITTDEVRRILEDAGKLYTQIKIDEITNLGAVKIRLRSLIGALEEKGV
ncbi:MAG: acyl-CoA dehydratase activase [Oscillospiraceae bacterium]|nr:acyl-CoA dehydratase activase [Oscillospiraceae bacterium]